jgi:TolA-binding protein
MSRIILAFAIALCALVLPGCIVGEIRDSLQSANNQLVCVQFTLDEVNKGLAGTNEQLAQTNERLDRVENGLTRLDRTNALIDNVEQGLGRIDNTNNSLTVLERQLVVLDSVEKSLQRLDQHLAGLRKTVGALDGVIPFLDLGGEYVEPSVAPPAEGAVADAGADAAAAEGANPAAAGTTPADGTPADGAAPATPAIARRDSLMGVWVSAFPTRDMALVLHADGTYERSLPSSITGPAAPGTPPRPRDQVLERGKFKREGSVVTFTPTPVQPDPAAVPDKDGRIIPAPAPAPWVVQIVSLSSRSLAVEDDGKLVLFGRP